MESKNDYWIASAAEPVDDHIRFDTIWDDRLHHLFVPNPRLDREARAKLSRAEACTYVMKHAASYVLEARMIYRSDPQGTTIMKPDHVSRGEANGNL